MESENADRCAYGKIYGRDSSKAATMFGVCMLRHQSVGLLVIASQSVRGDTGNRLPKLSLLKLSPPWNGGEMFSPDRITDMRVDVSPTRGSNFWGPRSVYKILNMRKIAFL